MSELSEFRKDVKGDIRDLRKEVRDVGENVSKISGILETAIPNFATKTELAELKGDIELDLAKHDADCRKSRDKHKRPSTIPAIYRMSYKKWIAICTAITAAAGTVTALILNWPF